MNIVISFDIGNTLLDLGETNNIYDNLLKYIAKKHISNFSLNYHCRLKKKSIDEVCNQLSLDNDELHALVKMSVRPSIYSDVLPVLKKLRQKGIKIITISNLLSIIPDQIGDCGLADYFELKLYSYDFASLKPSKKCFYMLRNILARISYLFMWVTTLIVMF